MHTARRKLSLHYLLSVHGDHRAETVSEWCKTSQGVAELECDAGVPFFTNKN